MRKRIRRVGILGALFLAASVAVSWTGTATAGPRRVPFHVCSVLPGLATPGDNFEIEAEGPKIGKKRVDRVGSVDATGCDSLGKVPAGKYTFTQTVNLDWQVARVYCFTDGSPRLRRAELDTELNAARFEVKGPGSCLFVQVPPGTELPEPAPGSPDTTGSPDTPGSSDTPGSADDEPSNPTTSTPTTTATPAPAPVPPDPPK